MNIRKELRSMHTSSRKIWKRSSQRWRRRKNGWMSSAAVRNDIQKPMHLLSSFIRSFRKKRLVFY
uniref:Uncharacterized protein n=1 Tax=Parascaris equorum TaxID=6256 RepID=A0A914S108_PAREQ